MAVTEGLWEPRLHRHPKGPPVAVEGGPPSMLSFLSLLARNNKRFTSLTQMDAALGRAGERGLPSNRTLRIPHHYRGRH